MVRGRMVPAGDQWALGNRILPQADPATTLQLSWTGTFSRLVYIPIMSSLYIKKFVDRLQHFELRGAKDFSCSLQDAKNLHNEITKLLLDLESLRSNAAPSENVVTVEMQGGSF